MVPKLSVSAGGPNSGGAPVDDPNKTDDAADKLRDAMNVCRPLVEGTTTTTTVPAGGSTTTTVAPDDGGNGGGAAIDSTPSTTAAP